VPSVRFQLRWGKVNQVSCRSDIRLQTHQSTIVVLDRICQLWWCFVSVLWCPRCKTLLLHASWWMKWEVDPIVDFVSPQNHELLSTHIFVFENIGSTMETRQLSIGMLRSHI
jgi:hypothetical protein